MKKFSFFSRFLSYKKYYKTKDEPFFMLRKETSGKNLTGNDRYMGYCVDLAEHLSKIVNFTYEFRLVKDNKFGAKGKIKFLCLMKIVNK